MRVFREGDDRQLISVAIREAETVRRAWPSMKVVARRDAPDMLADPMMEYHITPPGNSRHRDTYDQFIATASSAASPKPVAMIAEIALAA